MFDTLDEELDMAADPEKGFAAPQGSQVYQHAEFDAEYGYPKKYRRTPGPSFAAAAGNRLASAEVFGREVIVATSVILWAQCRGVRRST